MMAKKKGKKKKGHRPPPVCKAILLCQSADIDADTGQADIFGVFGELALQTFPNSIPPFIVFLQLTNGFGKYRLIVEVQDLHDGQLLAKTEGLVDFTEKLVTKNFVISVSLLFLARPGVYDVVVLADGQEIDRQQFVAIMKELEDGFEETEP
jgi:hypothetical protein